MLFLPVNAVTYYSMGSGAGILVHYISKQLLVSVGGWGVGVPPASCLGSLSFLWESKTPKEGVEESHIPLAGTGKRAF